MNRSTWKQSERDMALALGGKRVPVTGRQRGDVPDVEHPTYAIEHKAGKVMSARMLEAVDQAVAAAAGTTKTPLVTIEQMAGRGHAKRRFVLIRLEDWIAWMGPAQQEVTE